jgi:hypothetical protein
MKECINIFIGYDDAHPDAYNVCRDSILRDNKRYDLEIRPINYNTVSDYCRVKDKTESTQFSFARFWTPWESSLEGVSIFVDSDFVFLESIDNLIDLYDDRYAVMCCKHADYTPKGTVKMDGKLQSQYPRKNWSSLIIFNNSHSANDALRPVLLNTCTGAYLHRFEWLKDSEIGALPVEWNWLVDYYTETADSKPKALHYTDGGPWLDGYENCSYSDEWHAVYNKICTQGPIGQYIYNQANYLPALYSKLGNDDISAFLKKNYAHANFEQDRSFIHNNIKGELTMTNISSYIYNELKKKSYSKADIQQNVFDINKQQVSNLSKNKFEVKYPSTFERDGIIRRAFLNIRNKKMSKRSLVLYFRGGGDAAPWGDFKNIAFVDIYHVIVLYNVIKLLINNDNLKSFNDVFIVKTNDSETFDAFKDLELSKNTGDRFIEDTCLFANTIHFSIGELPDLYSFTQPIISSSYIFNDFCSPEIDDKFVFDAIYPEARYNGSSEIEYCDDPERYYNGMPAGWRDICSDLNNLNTIHNSRGDVYKVVENIVNVIYNLDNALSNNK